jgi:Zn-dependent protease with chaperone function
VSVHLYFFLLVVVSLACGSLPPADVSLLRASLATAGMVVAWGILCHVCARLCARQVQQESMDPLLGAEILERQLSGFRWLGLGVVVLCLGGFGLARGIEAIPHVGDSLFLQSLILLTPGLLITASTWSAEHRYGVLLGYTDNGIANHLRLVWQAFRGNAAWLVAPVLVLLGLADAIALLPVDREVAGWITAGVILLFVPLGLPWLIRHLFKTGPMREPTERWIAELLRSAGLRRTKAARWNTGGRTFNAMVVGFVPPLRTLLVSDRLLDELPPTQVAMVVLHEAAHLKRRHVPIRMLAILPAWGAAAMVSRFAGGNDWAMFAGSAVGIMLTMLILRFVAYRTEYDADVVACRLAVKIAGHVDQVPATYDQACDALSTALMRVTFDQPSCRKGTWLHPGVSERIAFMRRQRALPTNNSSNAGAVANPA